MSCYFERHIHSQQLFCVREDLSQVSFQAFWQDVAQQSSLIEKLEFPVWALWENSSYEFLVLLLAALNAGKEVLLPPHRVADLEKELAQQHIFFLKRQSMTSTKTEPSRLKFDDAFLQHAQLYFYTSGSTGQPKRIPRTLTQLFNEVKGLNSSFHLPAQAIAIATVSHQHIYGLLFKLLWPLMSGRSFYDVQLAFPEDVVALQKKISIFNTANYVISSPALLKRWEQDIELINCSNLYSSGGKLEAGIRPKFNVQLSEIFGSSETGGIAYRHQDNDVWTPFVNVEVKASDNGELAVKANHAFAEDWILTGDKIELTTVHDVKSSFKLLGRLDRIVKLEEKRLSLDAIEQTILRLPEIAQIHVLVLEQAARQRLASLVVLTQQGRQKLEQCGKAKFVAALKVSLSEKLEAIAIPKQWRFLAKLPQNAQSKLNKQYMKSLFSPMILPVVIDRLSTDDGIQYQLDFIPELECFKGHFPQHAIYPGVGQIAFIQHFAKENWADLQWCNGYEQLKFQDLIQPFMQVTLSLIRKANKVVFELKSEHHILASGRLLFVVDPAMSEA